MRKGSVVAKRKPTVCQSCFHNSYNGRVCKGCLKFYGTAQSAIAGSAMQRAIKDLTVDQVYRFLGAMCDVMVPDFPSTDMYRHVMLPEASAPAKGVSAAGIVAADIEAATTDPVAPKE